MLIKKRETRNFSDNFIAWLENAPNSRSVNFLIDPTLKSEKVEYEIDPWIDQK